MKRNGNVLWLRWILANGFSELVGLGSTFLLIGFLTQSINTQQTIGIVLSFFIAVLSGAIEATIVGISQWWAMHPWFQTVKLFAWWRGTLIGALISYSLGYLPSTLMSMGEVATQSPQSEPPQWVTLLLAILLGVMAGAVLSFAQWLELRGKVKRSGLWIPANMLAWAIGMPVIFWGMDLAFTMTEIWQSIIVIGCGLFVAGLLVGLIHGRFLVIIARDG